MQNADNILEHLLAIRADVGTIKEDVRELKNRMVSLDAGQAIMIQILGHRAGVTAQQRVSHDPSSNE